jgi:hypothetical protein
LRVAQPSANSVQSVNQKVCKKPTYSVGAEGGDFSHSAKFMFRLGLTTSHNSGVTTKSQLSSQTDSGIGLESMTDIEKIKTGRDSADDPSSNLAPHGGHSSQSVLRTYNGNQGDS